MKPQTITENKEVLGTLEVIGGGGTTPAGKELIFDPETGEFVTPKPGDRPSPNSVTVGKIAQDGFA